MREATKAHIVTLLRTLASDLESGRCEPLDYCEEFETTDDYGDTVAYTGMRSIKLQWYEMSALDEAQVWQRVDRDLAKETERTDDGTV